jgi:hypothetical protein
VLRRELFWNGKSSGNSMGTISNMENCFYNSQYHTIEKDLLFYIKDSLISMYEAFWMLNRPSFGLVMDGMELFWTAAPTTVNFTSSIQEFLGLTKSSAFDYNDADKHTDPHTYVFFGHAAYRRFPKVTDGRRMLNPETVSGNEFG